MEDLLRRPDSKQHSFFGYRLLLLPLAVGVIFLPFIPPATETAPALVYLLGRFHPLVVHFPVVLVLLALVFEAARKFRFWDVSPLTVGVLLAMALAGCVVSLVFGFLLYYTGEYTGDTMQGHLWGGVLLTASVAVALFLFLSFAQSGSRPVYTGYFSLLLFANVVLLYTSHQGGSLTHGSEYLTEYWPSFEQTDDAWEAKPLEQMLVYDDMIVPILNRKCMSCHNENKTKGDLLMTSYAHLLKGGKSEHPTLTPGVSAASDLYRRVTLPLDDDDRMPPKGKAPLTDNEIALLRWWIDQGADTTQIALEATKDEQLQPMAVSYLAELDAQKRARQMQKESLEKFLASVPPNPNYVLQLDPYDEKGVTLSMPFPLGKFSDQDLLAVQSLFSSITKASFFGSGITDDAFFHLSQMPRLKELYLQQTQITGAGLVHLANLKNLRLLDLSRSKVTDGNLLHALALPALEDLYLNETGISKDIVEALRENRPNLNVHLQRGRYF
jgi:uncharacterized membrane protein